MLKQLQLLFSLKYVGMLADRVVSASNDVQTAADLKQYASLLSMCAHYMLTELGASIIFPAQLRYSNLPLDTCRCEIHMITYETLEVKAPTACSAN